MNLKNLKLITATIEDYPTIQNMARFYVYDMTQDLDFEIPQDGLYSCYDFKKYWLDKAAHVFFIYYQSELAGFVIIDKKGSDTDIDFNMAQFFVLRKFQGKGVGTAIVHRCFEQFPGTWEIMVMPGNKGAYKFWEKIISGYTNKKFLQYTRSNPHLGHNEKRNMFRFKV